MQTPKDFRTPLWVAVHPEIRGHEGTILEAVLGGTDYGVLITQLASRQDLLCNARFGELFGIPPEEIVLQDPAQVRQRVLPRLKNPDRFLEDLHYVYGRPDLERVDELELVGPEMTLRRHTAPLTGPDGHYLGRVWTFLDVTPLKRLQSDLDRHVHHLETLVEERTREIRQIQKQLLLNEKLSAVGVMATAVAHELRNILTPLMIELGAIELPDEEAARILNAQIQRMMALTHQLLSVSQPPRLQSSRTDLREVWRKVEPLIRAQAEQNGCRLEVRLPDQAVPVEVNADQIAHIFVNLSLNAFQVLSPTGGSLAVEMSVSDDSAFCRFTDDGPGVPAQIVPTLFDPFTSGHRGGADLGLYNCRRIAMDHGGNVTLDRHAPGRTQFTLRLPGAWLIPVLERRGAAP
jgi:signal transduction histidine kinase